MYYYIYAEAKVISSNINLFFLCRLQEKTDAGSNSQTSTDNDGTDYEADVSCVSGSQSRLSTFSEAEFDTTINPQSSFQTTYCDSSSYVIHSLSRQLHEGSRYQDTVSECYVSIPEIIKIVPKQGMSYEKTSFPSVSILAQVDDTFLSCHETRKSVESDNKVGKNIVPNTSKSRGQDKESDSLLLSMDSVVHSNSMQFAGLKKINDENPCSENVSINTVSSMKDFHENGEKLVDTNSDTPVKIIDDERTVVKGTDHDSIFSTNQSRNKALNDLRAQTVFLGTPCRPAAARHASSKPAASLQGESAQAYKDATEESFKVEPCEPVVKRKRRRGKPPLNMPRNKKNRRGNDFMKLYASRPNLQGYLDASYTRQEPTSIYLKRVRDTIVGLGICSRKDTLIRSEMSARAISPLFSSTEGMIPGDKIMTMKEGTHNDIPNGFFVFESASHSPAPSAVPQTGNKDTVTSLDDIVENGSCVDYVVITEPSTNFKSEISISNAVEAWESPERIVKSRKKAKDPSHKVTEKQENTLFEDPLSIKRRLRTRQVVPLYHRKEKGGKRALHAAAKIFKGEGKSYAECRPRSRRNMKEKHENVRSNLTAIKQSLKIASLGHSECPNDGIDSHSLIQPSGALLKQVAQMEIDTKDHPFFMLKESISAYEPCNSQQPKAKLCSDAKEHEDKVRGVLKGRALTVSAIRSTKHSQKESRANESKERCVAKRWSLRIAERNNSKEFREPENSAKASVLTNEVKLGNGNQKGESGKKIGKKRGRCIREKANKDHIHENDSSVKSVRMTKSKNRVCGERNQFENSETKKRRGITSRAGTNDDDVDICYVEAVTADSLNLAGCYALKEEIAVDAENTTMCVNSSRSLCFSNNAGNKDVTEISSQGSKPGEIPCKKYREHNGDYSMLHGKISKMEDYLVCEVDPCVSPTLVSTSKSDYGSEAMAVNYSVNCLKDEPETKRSVLNCQRRRTVSAAPKLIFIEEDQKSNCLAIEKEGNGISVVRPSVNVEDLDKSTAQNDNPSKNLDAPVAKVASKRDQKRRNNTQRAAEVAKKVFKKREGFVKDSDLSKEETLISQQKKSYQFKAVDKAFDVNKKSEVKFQEQEGDMSRIDFSNVTREEDKSTNDTGSVQVVSVKNKNRKKKGKDETGTNFKKNDISSVTTLQKPYSCDLSGTVNSTKTKSSSSSSFKKVDQPVSPTGKSSRITERSSSKGN
eukprot:Seg2968.1 transcript_id=Seg2968.1/GoldUCD/mRNA.D3Y31 product="hypothetical protein" protein_id=Seg2968.1/GoldUCD/D3Y31